MARLSEPANYRDSPADPPDRTVLCAELPGSPDDEWWSLDAAALGRLVAAALVAEGLPDPTPTDVVVRRVDHVYPVYRLGHDVHQRALEAWADGARRARRCSGASRCSPTTTPTTAWRWAGPRRRASVPAARSTAPAGQRCRDGFRDHVVED